MANQRKSALKFDWRPLASPSLASAYRRSKALGKPWSTKNYSLTLPRWKSLRHRSSHDQPLPGSFFQRPKEAEEGEAENEVVILHLIGDKATHSNKKPKQTILE